MRKPQIVIVGAGIAGAATAWSLKQAGIHDILVVERSCQPGLHATKKKCRHLKDRNRKPLYKTSRERVKNILQRSSGKKLPIYVWTFFNGRG